jgi:putative PIN family toxin of toxin-antitoxin system
VSRILRVVLDTTTLVSAALREGSIPHQALLKALASCDVCASVETLEELASVLDRSKFDRYLDRDLRREFVALIRRRVQLFAVGQAEVSAVQPRCRDPKDDPFLALALAAKADIIVSSDEDLLALHPWRGIPILPPAAFISVGLIDQPDQT